MVPVFVSRLTPAAPEPLEVVLPKLSVALDVSTLMPIPVGFVTVVVGDVRLPAALVRLMNRSRSWSKGWRCQVTTAGPWPN